MSTPEATNLVIARLLDYFGRRTDWQRRLWNPGTVTVLREVVEAADLLSSGHLRERTVKALATTARVRAGPDHGVGSPAVRSTVVQALQSLQDAPKDLVARFKLEHLVEGAETNYLGRWSDVLSAQKGALAAEAASRTLAGHLLGLGFSPDHLHRWTTWLMMNKPPSSLQELFGEAEEVARRKNRLWDIFVPFNALELQGQQMPPEWLRPSDATQWISQNAPKVSIRHNGGFCFTIEARDPWAAVEEASDLIESLAAQVAVGHPGSPRFEPCREAAVAGSEKRFPLGRPRRQVDVHSLKRQNALFATGQPALKGRLRSAIDLVAPLETGAPGASVAGGWAAVEAVLARPGTPNVEAATDLAALVACSFPRAELTPLSFAYESENQDELAESLRCAPSNLERCLLLGNAIENGMEMHFRDPSDQAALERVRSIFDSPQEVLHRVSKYVDEALRRLYRQRNMVLHAGKTDSVAMTSVLRTVPPLVGAGLDRLVHDALVNGHSDPLRLVARARTALELCGQDGGPKAWNLLGH